MIGNGKVPSNVTWAGTRMLPCESLRRVDIAATNFDTETQSLKVDLT